MVPTTRRTVRGEFEVQGFEDDNVRSHASRNNIPEQRASDHDVGHESQDDWWFFRSRYSTRCSHSAAMRSKAWRSPWSVACLARRLAASAARLYSSTVCMVGTLRSRRRSIVTETPSKKEPRPVAGQGWRFTCLGRKPDKTRATGEYAYQGKQEPGRRVTKDSHDVEARGSPAL
jgi:hypothetical protein